LQMCARTSDFVGAPPFFAILRYSSNFMIADAVQMQPRDENRREK